MFTSLVWPVIIAGSNMYGANRNTVLDVLEAFRYIFQCLIYRLMLIGVADFIDCNVAMR